MSPPAGPAPLLIVLPQGLVVSGVTSWAVRLANSLAPHRPIALLCHDEPSAHARLDMPLHPRATVHRPGLPPLWHGPQRHAGDPAAMARDYARVVESLRAVRSPVVILPNLHADCYAACAGLTRQMPESVRIVGWQHSDSEYDARILARYEPVLSHLVGVSDHIESTLRSRIPGRAPDIRNIPYGVEAPPRPPPRPPRRAPGPVRLIYAGRIEHRQKRITALFLLSRALDRRGVAHTLEIIGDGPALGELRRLAAGAPSITLHRPAGPARIALALERADAFVLPSRFEGLSIALLEAMARGCIPIACRTASGAAQAISDNHNGYIADVDPDEGESAAADALADAVERLAASPDRAALSRAAWRTARERFGLRAHARLVEALLADAGVAGPRAWPPSRPLSFTSAGAAGEGDGGAGSVPADAASRMADILARLAGRAVIIHGTGAHTRALGAVLAPPSAAVSGRPAPRIVAFADDDRQVHGTRLWGRPVVAPEAAAATGATDVVISSFMHEGAIWARRGVYERQGLTVHALYAPPPSPAPSAESVAGWADGRPAAPGPPIQWAASCCGGCSTPTFPPRPTPTGGSTSGG